jgi:hypothetical protein
VYRRMNSCTLYYFADLTTCCSAVASLHDPPRGQFDITSCLTYVLCLVHRYCKRSTVQRPISYDVNQMLTNATARNSDYSIIRSTHCLPLLPFETKRSSQKQHRYAPHNDVSVNDGPHIRRWLRQIII